MTDIAQLALDVHRLQEDVDYLLVLVEPDLPTSGPPSPATAAAGTQSATRAAGAHVWHKLTPAQAADAWKELAGWVDWLTDRYQLEEALPACWYRHGALVEELDALRVAWNGAYQNPGATPTDPATWHEHLTRALAHIHDWNRFGCTASTHHEDTTPTATDADHEDRDRHVQDDIQARASSQRESP